MQVDFISLNKEFLENIRIQKRFDSNAEAITEIAILDSKDQDRAIIKDGKNGYLWLKTSELVNKTSKLIENEKLYKELVIKAKNDSNKYNYQRFKEEVFKLVSQTGMLI